MWSFTVKPKLLLQLFAAFIVTLAFIASSGPTVAQERLPLPDETHEEAAVKVSEAVQNAKSTLQRVLEGDPTAIATLFADYLVPAALALLALICGYMLASFIGRLVGSIVADNVDLTLGKFVGRMVTNALLLLIGLGILSYFGIETSSFAAILAAAGFAVGLALQGTLSNFAAGVMLLVFRPFKIEDFVVVGNSSGFVDEIDLFTTRINTTDNRHLIVPNSQIFNTTIENYTRNEVRRVDVSVGVAYDADLRQTRQVLADAINVIPGAVREPAPQVYLHNLGDSSVNWQLRVWCRPANYWDVRERVTGTAKDALDANGIAIPFPQLDLHVVSAQPKLKVA
jgi:small conductance mechanosensitive channel